MIIRNVKVWNGSAFVESAVRHWDGSQWVEKQAKYWDSSIGLWLPDPDYDPNWEGPVEVVGAGTTLVNGVYQRVNTWWEKEGEGGRIRIRVDTPFSPWAIKHSTTLYVYYRSVASYLFGPWKVGSAASPPPTIRKYIEG